MLIPVSDNGMPDRSDSQSECSTLVCWKVVGLSNALVWEQSLPPDWLEERAAGRHGRDGAELSWLRVGDNLTMRYMRLVSCVLRRSLHVASHRYL